MKIVHLLLFCMLSCDECSALSGTIFLIKIVYYGYLRKLYLINYLIGYLSAIYWGLKSKNGCRRWYAVIIGTISSDRDKGLTLSRDFRVKKVKSVNCRAITRKFRWELDAKWKTSAFVKFLLNRFISMPSVNLGCIKINRQIKVKLDHASQRSIRLSWRTVWGFRKIILLFYVNISIIHHWKHYSISYFRSNFIFSSFVMVLNGVGIFIQSRNLFYRRG